MKPRTLFNTILVAALMTAGAAAVAADKPALQLKKGPQVQQGTAQLKGRPAPNPCPQGWMLSSPVEADGSFMCKPLTPRPVKCPPKTEWVSDGCIVGCRPIIY